MTTYTKFQSGAYVDKFGYQEETLCSKLQSTPSKIGNRFEIKRPHFKSGTHIKHLIQADSIDHINRRANTGNREIQRHNFEAPPIRPRDVIDFDKLAALDIETQGVKIQLGDKTLEELFKTKVPDDQDTTWLAEKARLVALYTARGMTKAQIDHELEVNKPLGREQRTLHSKQNIGQSSLSVQEKLKEIDQEVKEGRAESQQQQQVLLQQFALVLADTNAISQLTQTQLTDLGQNLARIGVPTNHKALGLTPRFVDITFYNKNPGMINLLLFSKVRESKITRDYNYDLIVKNFASTQAGYPAIKLTSAVANLNLRGRQRRYLDLHEGGVISYNQMQREVQALKGGFSSPEVSIDPAHQ